MDTKVRSASEDAQEDLAKKLEGTEFSGDLTSKKNVALVMEKIKADRELMPAAMKMFNENQEMNRSLTKAAYEVKQKKDEQGVPQHAKNRMTKQGQALLALQKRDGAVKKGEFVCVSITNNGKRSRMTYSLEELRSDNYSANFTTIGGVSFFVVSHESCLGEKVNRTATHLLNWEGITCCGTTGFMMLDRDGNPKDISVDRFKELEALEDKTRGKE